MATSGAAPARLEPLLSKREAWRLLGISEPSLRRLMRSGAIRPVRVGGLWKFEPAEIRRYLLAAKTPLRDDGRAGTRPTVEAPAEAPASRDES